MVKKGKGVLEKELEEIGLSIEKRNKVILIFVFWVAFCFMLIYIIGSPYQGGIEDNEKINISVFEIEETKEEESCIDKSRIIVNDSDQEGEIKVSDEGHVKIHMKQDYIGSALRNVFEPERVEVEKGDVLEWNILDDRRHKISCYKNDWRVFMSEDFYPGENVETSFDNVGEYLCIDVIYGARGYIIVK